jgi:hypothetical protein
MNDGEIVLRSGFVTFIGPHHLTITSPCLDEFACDDERLEPRRGDGGRKRAGIRIGSGGS